MLVTPASPDPRRNPAAAAAAAAWTSVGPALRIPASPRLSAHQACSPSYRHLPYGQVRSATPASGFRRRTPRCALLDGAGLRDRCGLAPPAREVREPVHSVRLGCHLGDRCPRNPGGSLLLVVRSSRKLEADPTASVLSTCRAVIVPRQLRRDFAQGPANSQLVVAARATFHDMRNSPSEPARSLEAVAERVAAHPARRKATIAWEQENRGPHDIAAFQRDRASTAQGNPSSDDEGHRVVLGICWRIRRGPACSGSCSNTSSTKISRCWS